MYYFFQMAAMLWYKYSLSCLDLSKKDFQLFPLALDHYKKNYWDIKSSWNRKCMETSDLKNQIYNYYKTSRHKFFKYKCYSLPSNSKFFFYSRLSSIIPLFYCLLLLWMGKDLIYIFSFFMNVYLNGLFQDFSWIVDREK